MQNHVFIFIRNVLGIKTIMRYTLSSITITKHPGTELRVISRTGRRAGGQDTQQTGGGRRAGCGPQGHTQRPPGGRGTLQHTRDSFLFWLFCVWNFFELFLFCDTYGLVNWEVVTGREQRQDAMKVRRGRGQGRKMHETWVEHKRKNWRDLETENASGRGGRGRKKERRVEHTGEDTERKGSDKIKTGMETDSDGHQWDRQRQREREKTNTGAHTAWAPVIWGQEGPWSKMQALGVA